MIASRIGPLAAVLVVLTLPAVDAQGRRGESPPKGPAPAAEALLEAGLSEARATSRTVFVDFYASWCGPCRQLDAFLRSSAAQSLIDEHFVVVKITVSEHGPMEPANNPGGDTLMDRLGGIGGLPFYAALDASGQKLWSGTGMPWGRSGAESFASKLADAAPRLTRADRTAIESTIAAYSGNRGAISGRVVDRSGSPVAGARVRALTSNYIDGMWRWSPSSNMQTAADEDGRYVFDDVLPQTYRIVVDPVDLSRHVTTFLGDTARLDDAARVALEPGQSYATSPVTMLVAPRPVAVTGTVATSGASPAAATVTLVSTDWPERTVSAIADGQGRFTVSGVPAGRYIAWARTARGLGAEGRVEYGRMEATIGDTAGSRALVIETSPGATIAGTVRMTGGALGDQDRAAVRVTAVPLSATPGAPSGQVTSGVAADGTFSLRGIFGAVALRVTELPPGWALSSVEHGQLDVTDDGLEVAGGSWLRDVSIEVTGRAATIAGRVSSAGTSGVSGAVVAFADEPGRWRHPSRFVRSAAVQPDGTFELTGVAPGTYRVAHVDVLDRNWQSPESLSALTARAESFTLAAGERRSITIGRN